MIVRIGKRGSSFKGAALYYLHDKREPGEQVRLTDERVAWTDTVNLANDNPELAWKEMARTAADQKELKREAGLRTGGNQVHAPVLPIVLSWAEIDRPTPDQQRAAAHEFLRSMGWDRHQALIVSHTDTPHPHVHILLNRVNPENGLVLRESYSHRHAQAWALQYQREHGQEWCPQREINAQARANGDRTQDNGQPYPLAKDAKAACRPAQEAEQQLATEARSEKEMQSERHQEEREEFLAAGAAQIRGIRTQVFLATRAEYKPQWRALHAAERAASGDKDKQAGLRDRRALLWLDVRSTTRIRQDMAVKEFIVDRRMQFRDLKERQSDERHALRDLLQLRDAGAPYDEKRLAELTGERASEPHKDQALERGQRAHDQEKVQRYGAANENQAAPGHDRDKSAEHARWIARQQAALTNSQSMPNVQLRAMREMKDKDRRDRSPVEITDDHIARRVAEMRREDEQRRARDNERGGDGRERERGRDR